MSVLPIDLQVLFSKVPDHSENIARATNAAQSGQLMSFEKTRQQSIETNATVKYLEQYSGEFNKINPDSGKNKEGGGGIPKGKGKKSRPVNDTYKPAKKEEGKGNFIDIID